MITCHICGHNHGPNVVHIKRTVDGVMGRYIEAMEKCKNIFMHEHGIIKPRTADHIINSAILKIGSR